MEPDVQALVEALRQCERKRLLVITGAGISLASGIPTYRGTDPGAVWENSVTELGTFHYFQKDPVGWWQWLLSLDREIAHARPNPAHRAVAALEGWHTQRGGSFLLVTQNVDTLHELAGSQELAKVHGSADRLRCCRVGCPHGAPRGSLPRDQFDLESLLRDPQPENLPRCPECGSLMRAHALLFDEYYTEHVDYQFHRVEAEAGRVDLALFVGTSFSVGITDLILQSALARRSPIFSIDPGARPTATLPIRLIPHKAEEVLPAVCRELAMAGWT